MWRNTFSADLLAFVLEYISVLGIAVAKYGLILEVKLKAWPQKGFDWFSVLILIPGLGIDNGGLDSSRNSK